MDSIALMRGLRVLSYPRAFIRYWAVEISLKKRVLKTSQP